MSYFSSLTAADRICFEGCEVARITPFKEKNTDTVSHYAMSVLSPEKGAEIRKFRAGEIPHLLENELLVIDHGYHSLARQTDRALYGRDEMFGAKKKQRARVDLIMFLCRRMVHHHALGMALSRTGVQSRCAELEREFSDYQARINYGTEKANATQRLNPLPANTTLLSYYRIFRRSAQNPMAFIIPRTEKIDAKHQTAMDFVFILRILYDYASPTQIAKSEVAQKAVREAEKENERRCAAGIPVLISVRSARTYERWIDEHLDPFTVELERKGLAAAKAKFGSIEKGMAASFPGQFIQFDAWKMHVQTLDTTRARYNAMSADQRAAVKRIRRWVVVAIDVATRAILGFAICKKPTQAASLEALRMCFADKTYLLEQAGLTKSSWDFRAPIHQVSTDCGSEFGKHPFGGTEFGEAMRRLNGSLMATVAGVPELRPHIERLFLTFELRWARHLPGGTAGKIHLRNDRKPHEEACITDDELHRLFVQFIDEYHNAPHRGLGYMTPAGMWEKLSKDHQFDLSQLPGPAALREACGIIETAGVSEAGIRYKNLVYANEFIQNQRMAKGTDRIAKPGEKLEVKVDPFDLGAITVLAGDDMISVPCLDETMRGKSLAWWMAAQASQKAAAHLDRTARANARDEAQDRWRGEAAAIANSAGVGPPGRSLAEIERLAREMKFGKGAYEKPFLGRDEYIDPIHSGFETGARSVDIGTNGADSDDTPATSFDDSGSAAKSLDRFRAKARHRLPRQGDAEDHR